MQPEEIQIFLPDLVSGDLDPTVTRRLQWIPVDRRYDRQQCLVENAFEDIVKEFSTIIDVEGFYLPPKPGGG